MPKTPTRLLAKAEDFEYIWQLIQTNEKARATYQHFKDYSEKVLQQQPFQYELCTKSCREDIPTLKASREISDFIYSLAMMYRLEGDKRYYDRAWNELQTAARLPDWNPRSFLDTAEMTHAFAIAYDWFPWTEDQRTVLRDAIVANGLKPALQCYHGEADFGWWVKADHNWNQVCNGGIGMGALALLPELQTLCQEVLDHAVKSLQLPMKRFAPDGGWPEGPDYWDYATSYNCIFLAASETATGTDFGLAGMPGFSDTGLFAIYMTGPTAHPFNFADGVDSALYAYQMLWMARKFHHPVYSWYPQTFTADLHHRHALTLLWFDPEERDPVSGGLPLDKHFRGAEVATFRSAWNDRNAIFLGFKAGDNKANHSHLDIGSFVLHALGERWVVDLGKEDYSLPGYFDTEGQRWTYYRLRAEGHNTLVLNPSKEPDQNPNAFARITRFRSEPEKAFAIADLTPAYFGPSKGYLKKSERGIALLDRKTVVVQDEITQIQPIDIWWFMHTLNSLIQLSDEERVALLQQGSTRLWCAVASPPEARFTVMDPKPLPSSPNPRGQDPNQGVKKLAIHLNGATSTRLSVVIVPLNVGQEPPTQLPAVAPLDEW